MKVIGITGKDHWSKGFIVEVSKGEMAHLIGEQYSGASTEALKPGDEVNVAEIFDKAHSLESQPRRLAEIGTQLVSAAELVTKAVQVLTPLLETKQEEPKPTE